MEVEAGRVEACTFKVYDCPLILQNEYIAWARLYEENKVWKVMEKAMEALKDTKLDSSELSELLTKIVELEARIERLENKPAEPAKPKEIKTFGGTMEVVKDE